MSVSATRLERVRVRCDGLDPTTARLRLDQLLACAELRPPGLPSAALLYVRRLSDPRPGTVPLRGGQVQPPPDWERAFVAALERMMREAARPARGPVPAGAEAVLFADRAELLACLARDVCDGTAWINWWWRGMLQTAPGMRAEPAVNRWLQEPEYVPAALELLAAWGSAAHFAQLVDPPVALQLAARVAGVFAAPQLRAALVAAPGSVEERNRRAAVDREPALPGDRFAPEAIAPALAAEQALMVSTVFTLRRAPAVARSHEFAEQVRRWRAAGVGGDLVPEVQDATTAPPAPVVAQPTGPNAPEQGPSSPAPRPRGTADRAACPPEPAASAAQGPVGRRPPVTVKRADTGSRPPALEEPDDPPITPGTAGAPAPPAAFGRRDPQPPTRDHDAPPELPRLAIVPAASTDDDRRPAARRARLRRAAESTEVPVTRAPPAPHAPALPDTADLALEVQTRLGGLFYLLNLALALELYGDFTAPLAPGIGLNPWELVDLLGAWLLGRRPDEPVWALLGALSGRGPRDPRGQGFRPPRAWRVPMRWLEPFENDGTWRWSAAAGVLRIVHPAGFTVTAVPRSKAAPEAQLRRELGRLGPLRPVPVRTSLRREPTRDLARWIARLGSYCDARLRIALGLGSDASLGTVLLEHRARVFVTPSHVDVVLNLIELPLEIRLAGLDRNPGWIPAAGHFVAFEFV